MHSNYLSNSSSLGHEHDKEWIKALIAPLGQLAERVAETYRNTYSRGGRRAANEQLRRHHEPHVRSAAQSLLITYGLNSGKAGLRIAKMFSGVSSVEHARSIAEREGLKFPKGLTPDGVINRCVDPAYWRRQLRSEEMRYRDQFARDKRQLGFKRQLYISDLAFDIYKDRQEHNAEFLTNELLATSDHGDEIYVAELADKSTSNPEIRRTELMVRARGMEEYAKEHGHPCTFATVTLPSEFHSSYKDSGRPNKSYRGASPKEANETLLTRWQCCRAELDRNKIRYYGLRVTEPHHDGCPHHHFWLFAESEEDVEVLEATIHKHFIWTFDVSRRTNHQVEFQRIDPEKGSAAGYIAKYISKNIDGRGLGSDEASSAERATAWARIWGVRQFDQLGGPPVTVWRQLRLQRSKREVPNSMHSAWEGANAPDWCEFIKAMGGPFRGRDYPIKTDRDYKFSSVTAERSPTHNRYGEPLYWAGRYDLRPIVGLVCGRDVLQTWQKFWKIERRLRQEADPPIYDAEGVGANKKIIKKTRREALGVLKRIFDVSVADGVFEKNPLESKCL